MLLELAAGEYRCKAAAPVDTPIGWTLPGDGVLRNRLAARISPLPLTEGDLDTLVRWAAEQSPDHIAEMEMLQTLRVRLATALRTRTEISGLLLLGPPAGRSAYNGGDRSIVNACAAQFALMIENGRLTNRVVEQEKLRRDLALAAEVQRRLLPERPPETPGATLAAMSVPARAVGGDYFDFLDAGDHGISIAFADVAGKGIAAALIMSALHASLRILASEAGLSLPQLAAKMNRFLYESTGSKSYATFFYARVEADGRQLRYVNAGHLPPYLLRPSPPSIQELSTGGAVIGLFPQMAYEEATVSLQSGDVLVIFTDGVTEAMNERDEEFGEERLKALLPEILCLPVGEISARISAELKAWINDAPQYDDLTFVVMKVN